MVAETIYAEFKQGIHLALSKTKGYNEKRVKN